LKLVGVGRTDIAVSYEQEVSPAAQVAGRRRSGRVPRR
jgi:hypothetical protein